METVEQHEQVEGASENGAEAPVEAQSEAGSEQAEKKTPQQPEKTPQQLFRFSEWVHVGPGAEQCEDVNEDEGTNDCANPLHFHAWCRLPNQFQHKEIREKALAAKARRVRLLRDPESDAHVVLEAELDELRDTERGKGEAIDELLQGDWFRDYGEARQDLAEWEDEKGEKPYEHFDDDEQKFRSLMAKPEDERPADELDSLGRHVAGYHERLEARLKEIQKPRREALEQKPIDELAAQVRDERIDADSRGEFMHIYNTWQAYIGGLWRPRGERRFRSVEEMQEAAPEVVDALSSVYERLEGAFNRENVQGNS